MADIYSAINTLIGTGWVRVTADVVIITWVVATTDEKRPTSEQELWRRMAYWVLQG
jgi:hypothetical protein